MPRHAEAYWLRVQANAALEKASTVEENLDPEGVSVPRVEAMREMFLRDAAEALVKAELCHRYIVRNKR